MLTFAKNLELVRIAPQNDWVVFIIMGCIFLYIFMLISLQRDSSVKDFLMQQFPDSSNTFLSWLTVSLVFALLSAAFVSPYIPIVPKKVSDLQLFGYELNKFGFAFFSITGFYILKTMLSYLYFAGTGAIKQWSIFYFTASKYYFCISILMIILCTANFFYEIDQLNILPYYGAIFFLMLIFKLSFYWFHKNNILPEKWYYKFLYICTLQILPFLVLWKVLFF